jgi:hypothetical protein
LPDSHAAERAHEAVDMLLNAKRLPDVSPNGAAPIEALLLTLSVCRLRFATVGIAAVADRVVVTCAEAGASSGALAESKVSAGGCSPSDSPLGRLTALNLQLNVRLSALRQAFGGAALPA